MAGNVCYICWGDGGALISQCSCRGTSGYVHEACLLDCFKSRGEWLDLNCHQCKHAFYGQLGVNLASFALSQVQAEDGEDSITYASALNNLASAFSRVGDYHKKKELLERALPIVEREYGPEHIKITAMLINLGNAFGDLGDYRKQKELLERDLSITEWEYGPEHLAVAVSLNDLGNAFGDLGDYQAQKELLERERCIYKKLQRQCSFPQDRRRKKARFE